MEDPDVVLQRVAMLAFSRMTPRELRRLGSWAGVEARSRNGVAKFRAVIADPRINAGRRIYLGPSPSNFLAAILHDLARIALGRETVNVPRATLANMPLHLLDDAWMHVLSRLYRHAGPTMRAALANTPNPFAGELTRGETARPIRIH